ncbi:hypothetical protein M407DRAFT_99253 [Tulasnella calospora MUT 4182]|uniref:Uncharacterized protein n=1 Tax=Tulasnella calospora MUT 4182 TaxID=1051891 RepID=A0A0C3QGK4_9AGAM|nr:hypothetical protein M407DRAFT_99253 [Tulasnella calospora MUT 4182]
MPTHRPTNVYIDVLAHYCGKPRRCRSTIQRSGVGIVSVTIPKVFYTVVVI